MNNYLNFEQGEISVYLCGDALANLHCSLEQAEAIRGDVRRGAVLYVNTSFTARKFRSAWREILGDPALDSRIRGNESQCVIPTKVGIQSESSNGVIPALDSRIRENDKRSCGNDTEGRIYSLDCPIGELLWQFDEMKKMVNKYNIRQIIINNWEYAFKNYQNKEEAIFRLHEFLNKEVSLLVYGQVNPLKAKAGKIMRGGLGKLSGLALSIFDLEKESKAQEEQNINLESSKINDLDSAQRPIIVQEKEETGTGDFSVNETGLISNNIGAKHLPMSNKNRKLLAEYEKLYGKAQLPGESYRDMFDRVVGKMIAVKVERREMVEA